MADNNFRSYANLNGVEIAGESITTADPAIDDVLKFSNCSNVSVTNCFVSGGKEDCIDCYRGANYSFANVELAPKGKNGITVKGGITVWQIIDGSFKSHGSECDIELGQFGIWARFPFSKDRTVGVKIVDSRADDGKPLRVKVWNADKPVVIGGNVKIEVVPWIVWFPYFCFRRIQLLVQGK